MHGSHTTSSAYADLVLEGTEGGGVLVFVRQYHGAEEGEARINLSSDQVRELRQWLRAAVSEAYCRSVAPE